jgi:hypothetical protein
METREALEEAQTIEQVEEIRNQNKGTSLILTFSLSLAHKSKS